MSFFHKAARVLPVKRMRDPILTVAVIGFVLLVTLSKRTGRTTEEGKINYQWHTVQTVLLGNYLA
ncbi:hypothetical protein KUTeg_011715 [Tegillarca granosa]|uniref:Uncharacterized protein n=1 Tax=Tegillarca granosa TaxID=220873 RepID=A0ABQ9F139_TEGGR|nr:hypothetical protein KUTeg_011715 [Tegillarca granosa]